METTIGHNEYAKWTTETLQELERAIACQIKYDDLDERTSLQLRGKRARIRQEMAERKLRDDDSINTFHRIGEDITAMEIANVFRQIASRSISASMVEGEARATGFGHTASDPQRPLEPSKLLFTPHEAEMLLKLMI